MNDPSLKRIMCFKNCAVVEGTFSLSFEEFRDITDYNSKLFSYYITIRRKFETVNNICVLYFKKHNVNKKHATIYGYCAHKNCKLFKIYLGRKADLYECTVFSSSLNYNHKANEKRTTYVRRTERQLLGGILKTSTLLKTRQEAILSTPSVQIENGNLRDIKSNDVYRKVKSEELSKFDRHKDEILDLILMARENSYIYRVFEPLTVIMFLVKNNSLS